MEEQIEPLGWTGRVQALSFVFNAITLWIHFVPQLGPLTIDKDLTAADEGFRMASRGHSPMGKDFL
jgi:hypothetical protein